MSSPAASNSAALAKSGQPDRALDESAGVWMVVSPQAFFLPHLPVRAKPGGTGAKDGER
jgi:hypothetical protein